MNEKYCQNLWNNCTLHAHTTQTIFEISKKERNCLTPTILYILKNPEVLYNVCFIFPPQILVFSSNNYYPVLLNNISSLERLTTNNKDSKKEKLVSFSQSFIGVLVEFIYINPTTIYCYQHGSLCIGGTLGYQLLNNLFIHF